MFEIIPGILETEWSEIEKKLELVKPFAKTVHIDIIDGKFANNTTFLDPKPFKKYADDFLLELHMMVDEPINYLKAWSEAGFKRFLGHIEKMGDPIEFIAQGQLLGAVGLAIDGPTSIGVLEKLNLENLDSLLIYTSDQVGHSGAEFNEKRLEKIKKMHEKNKFLPIEVDGGINNLTIEKARSAGASRFISTSYLFLSQNPQLTFQELSEKLR